MGILPSASCSARSLLFLEEVSGQSHMRPFLYFVSTKYNCRCTGHVWQSTKVYIPRHGIPSVYPVSDDSCNSHAAMDWRSYLLLGYNIDLVIWLYLESRAL